MLIPRHFLCRIIRRSSGGDRQSIRAALAFMARVFVDFVLAVVCKSTDEARRQLPGMSVYGSVCDRGFIVDRFIVDDSKPLDKVGGGAIEIADHVQPGFGLEIGHIDHQRIALPVATRVSLPQFDISPNMWPISEGNNASLVIFLSEE